MDRQKTSIAAAMLLGAALSFGAGKLLPDGTSAHATNLSCNTVANVCGVTLELSKDGKIVGEKEIVFYFDGKVLDGQGNKLKGKPPEVVLELIKAFKSGSLNTIAEIK